METDYPTKGPGITYALSFARTGAPDTTYWCPGVNFPVDGKTTIRLK